MQGIATQKSFRTLEQGRVAVAFAHAGTAFEPFLISGRRCHRYRLGQQTVTASGKTGKIDRAGGMLPAFAWTCVFQCGPSEMVLRRITHGRRGHL